MINRLLGLGTMSDSRIDNDDLETFARHLGFNGIDTDLFYETYYLMDSDEYDEYYDMVELEEYLIS